MSDKDGIASLGTALAERGWELLSTGGTAAALREAGLDVTNVSDVTRHPEMMDGRVKTLHPAIHAGLLARRDREADLAALEEHGYAPIDLVAVNLYPFRETVAQSDVSVEQAMGKVDIGGPTMIRAAAKSHKDVWVVVDPADYEALLAPILDGRADAVFGTCFQGEQRDAGHHRIGDGIIAISAAACLWKLFRAQVNLLNERIEREMFPRHGGNGSRVEHEGDSRYVFALHVHMRAAKTDHQFNCIRPSIKTSEHRSTAGMLSLRNARLASCSFFAVSE